jgi:hypothetical protein
LLYFRDLSGCYGRRIQSIGCKSVLDSLVMGGVIRDDTQVVFLNARSVYASKSEGPCVEVRLSSIDCDGPSG